MRLFSGSLVLLMGQAAVAAAPPPTPPPPPDDIFLAPPPALRGALLADGQGYVVANPEPLPGSGVRKVLVSADSRWVLMVCETRRDEAVAALRGKIEDAPGEESLVRWDTLARQSTVLWRQALRPGERGGLDLSGWLGQTRRAMGKMTRYRDAEDGTRKAESGLVLVDPAAGTVRVTSYGKTGGYVGIHSSPTTSYAALVNAEGAAGPWKEQPGGIRFFRADGTVTDPVPLPNYVWFSRWSEDGTEYQGSAATDDDGEKWLSVNPATGKVREIAPPPKGANGETRKPLAYNPLNPSPDLPLRLASASLDKDKPPVLVVTDAAGSEKVYLTSEGTAVALLPDGSAALFTIAGRVYQCAIRPVPAAVVLAWREGNVRKETEEQVWPIGDAFYRYWRTHDHQIPAPTADLSAALSLTPDQLARFTYTPPKEPLANIKALLSARLGRIQTPSGKSTGTVFGDGHIVWDGAAR